MRISDWSSDVCSSDLKSFDNAIRLLGPPPAAGLGSRRHGGAQPEAAGTLNAVRPALLQLPGLLPLGRGPPPGLGHHPIGRASYRDRVWQYVEFSVVARNLTKKRQAN